MTTRPAFDATVYETPELAAIYAPGHDLFWNERDAAKAHLAGDTSADEYLAVRKLLEDRLAVENELVAAYVERAENAETPAEEELQNELAF